LRSSRTAGAEAARDVPHIPQRRNPSGFSWPHAGHVCMP
jgi:hypothetical protein